MMERSRSTSPQAIFNRGSVASRLRGSRNSMTQPEARPPVQQEKRQASYYQNSELPRSAKPLFRLQMSRQRQRPIKPEPQDSSESSGDIRPSMDNIKSKSPKMTGNFAAAFRMDQNGSSISNGKSGGGERRSSRNFDSTCNRNYPSEIKREIASANCTSVKPLKNEILDDWTSENMCDTPINTSPYGIKTRKTSTTSTGGMSPSINSKLQFKVAKIPDGDSSIKDSVHSPDKARAETTLNAIKIDNFEEEDTTSDTSQVTLPPNEDTESVLKTLSMEDEEDKGEVTEIPGSPVNNHGSRLSRKRRVTRTSEANSDVSEKQRSRRLVEDNAKAVKMNSEAPNKLSQKLRLEESSKTRSRSPLRSKEQGADYATNMQLTNNMDKLSIHMYLDWLWRNYRQHFSSSSSVDIIPLLQKILMQPEVHFLIEEKIKEIRSNVYLMETKKTVHLYSIISDVVRNIIEKDLEQVKKVYHTTLCLFSGRRS